MAAVMGGHFFCLPLADGECRGSVPRCPICLLRFIAAKYMCFLCQLGKLI